MIRGFEDFVKEVLTAGFSMGGGSADGVYTVIDFDWRSQDPNGCLVWHTGDKETDPWEWRMRVLEERNDIAYAKLFFKKSGYISREWYPYFLCARRKGRSFEEDYADGKFSRYEKEIYEIIESNASLPVHLIKAQLGYTKEEKYAFDKALVNLQIKMYITMCGSKQKTNFTGEKYGWASTVFCITEEFFDDAVFYTARKTNEDEAFKAIKEQILKLNPEAEDKQIKKFIYGK